MNKELDEWIIPDNNRFKGIEPYIKLGTKKVVEDYYKEEAL